MNTDEAIRERVDRLPPKLGDLYREIYDQMTNIPEVDFRVAKHAFSWLICALQPLKSENFLTAISISPGGRFSRLSKDQVLAICRNFVIYDSSLDIFRFAHLSVREFLENQEEYHSSAAHSIASAICLSQLISNSSDPKVKSFLSSFSKPWLHPHSSEDWFHAYASVYWALHCQLAATQRARGTLKDLFLFFLSDETTPTAPFSLWTSEFSTKGTFTKIKKRNAAYFDIELRIKNTKPSTERIKFKMPSPRTIFLACCFDFREVVADSIASGAFCPSYINSQHRTALDTAIRHGSCGVLSEILAHTSIRITQKQLREAAASGYNAKAMMSLLLSKQGNEIRITEAIVKEAAYNARSGISIMSLLLDQRGDEVQITEAVVRKAAENYRLSDKMISLLLDRRGEEIKITDDIVRAAAGNPQIGREVLQVLLSRRGDELLITEEVVKIAALNSPEVMSLLLDQGCKVKITEEVVKNTATI
jgi:hypothetical protein